MKDIALLFSFVYLTFNLTFKCFVGTDATCDIHIWIALTLQCLVSTKR